VWHIVWAIILLWGLWQDFGIWKTALAPSPYGVVETAQGELAQSGKQAWMLDGTRYEADHATSTSPDFGAVNVTGYDSQNNVIWAVHAVNVIQRVK
jgi:hypothetical protein